MRLGVLALAVAACVGFCVALMADEPQVSGPATSWVEVGMIVSVSAPADASAADSVAFDLRVDASAEVKSPFKPGEVLKVQVPREQMRGIGLGDQVRAAFDQAPAAGKTNAASELLRLGRGEFVNPGEKATMDLGAPDAKVLVKMFAPLGIACHQPTVDLLTELATAEPKRLRVQIFDVRDPASAGEANRERLTCATVLVNNRYQFTIPDGDKERKVEFAHKPNAEESTYNSEDVPVVVRQEIQRIYGPEKPAAEPKVQSGAA